MKTGGTSAFLAAFKTMSPIIAGIIPTGFAYALIAGTTGISGMQTILSSVMIFGGSVQFLMIELVRENVDYLQFAIIVFLIHSRHMFYGISLFDKFDKTGKAKPFMIFSTTDESYAVLTSTKTPPNVNEGTYYIFASLIVFLSWVGGTLLGVIAVGLMSFNTAGMDFALTATFIVIMLEQMKSFHTKIPFIIGGLAAVVSLIIAGPSVMLLGCGILSVAALLLLRKRMESTETGEGAAG